MDRLGYFKNFKVAIVLSVITYQLPFFRILGTRSFNRQSLHHIGNVQNPYEEAISIIGQTLSALDEDNLIPCFGFGDGNFV